MKRLPRLVEITPEGRIVAALFESPQSYGELRAATGLSDRWLAKKVKELAAAQVVERYGDQYRLRKPTALLDVDPLFAPFLRKQVSLEGKARLMAEEIACDEGVVAVILFGSVVKGVATEESDIDLLIVTEKEMEDQLDNLVYSLMFKYDTPVEAVFQTYDELVTNLQARTAFSFGLLEGYEVLYDRGGVEGLLSIKKKVVQENWVYDEEAGTWLQKKLMPTV